MGQSKSNVEEEEEEDDQGQRTREGRARTGWRPVVSWMDNNVKAVRLLAVLHAC